MPRTTLASRSLRIALKTCISSRRMLEFLGWAFVVMLHFGLAVNPAHAEGYSPPLKFDVLTPAHGAEVQGICSVAITTDPRLLYDRIEARYGTTLIGTAAASLGTVTVACDTTVMASGSQTIQLRVISSSPIPSIHVYLDVVVKNAGAPSAVGGRNAANGYGAGDLTKRFTGMERDAETGLHNFGARYLSSSQGRFTSPDLPFADHEFDETQSWNLYAYGRNNPLANVDIGGRYVDPRVVKAINWMKERVEKLPWSPEKAITLGILEPASIVFDSSKPRKDRVIAGISLASNFIGPEGKGAGKILRAGDKAIDFARGLGKAGKAAKEVASDIKVIGRLEDAGIAKQWPGHDVLDVTNWNLKKNMQWVDEGIARKQHFYVGSPTAGNMVQTSGSFAGQPTVFTMEIERLQAAGYKRLGDYFLHPGNVAGF
jgi:RHS repeat-associated protein